MRSPAIVLVVAGVAVIGLAVFEGIEELLAFGGSAFQAGSEADLGGSARHFANAVSILGAPTVLAILFRGAPKTWRGEQIELGAPPKYVKGAFSRPPLRSTCAMPAGEGVTMPWGDITISRLGSKADRRLVALHEASIADSPRSSTFFVSFE